MKYSLEEVQVMGLGDIIELLASNDTEALVYNRLQGANTWEPMILAKCEFLDGILRVKLVPKRCSPAFPGDLVCLWTEEQLQKRIRKIEVKV